MVVVLIAGHAFADFSGNARIVFAADLNKKEFGFNDVATGNYTFDFTYDTLPAGKDAHETDLWAEIAVAGSVDAFDILKLSTDTSVWEKDSVKKGRRQLQEARHNRGLRFSQLRVI